MEIKLTIGLTHYDDYAGAWQTLMGIFANHKEVIAECEFIIVDNNPGSAEGKALRHFVTRRVRSWGSRDVKYVPFADKIGVAPVRNELFQQAEGEYVLCIDCHTVFPDGVLAKLLEYVSCSAAECDLLTGPIIMDDGQTVYTHQARQWTSSGFGVWGEDPQHHAGNPFEIDQQGLGLFCTRKDGWIGFHEEMRGFGCVESVLCEKYRQEGHKVLCLPFLRWYHRFNEVLGASYPISEYNTARNHIIGFREVKWDLDSLLRHYKYRLTERERFDLTKEFYLDAEW